MCGHFWRAEARLAAPAAVSDAPQNLVIKIKTKYVTALDLFQVNCFSYST